MTKKSFATTTEVADACGVTVQAVNYWVRRGWIDEADTGREGTQARTIPLAEVDRVKQNRKLGLPVYFRDKRASGLLQGAH